jgi:hypothetical protein
MPKDLRTTVRPGQVWICTRKGHKPVVHVVTRVKGDTAESTSVFTSDGEVNHGVILSGEGCEGRGIKNMLTSDDWKLVYNPGG